MTTMLDEDIAYIRANYSPLSALVAGRAESVEDARTLVAAKKLPGPAYVLPDGTEMFPRDWFALADSARGVDGVHAEFERRFRAAAEAHGEPASEEMVAAEWDSYLSGLYAVCLREVTPENMFRKEQLVRHIKGHLASPRPDDAAWRARLRADVEELDGLERPFTAWDRVRFGGSVSRDRWITAVRAEYAACFSDDE